MKKIVFLTGTRADYGKIKSLIEILDKNSDKFNIHIFITGMHMLSKYGSTYKEIEKDGFKNLFYFINQKDKIDMSNNLGMTILGFNDYIKEIRPDMIIVHGDRIEALAGATVGALNNILVSHIEGGEVSGTIDESIRHAITKLSHIHLVANSKARQNIIQLGENQKQTFIIGSPDIDIMFSENIPSLNETKDKYEIEFNEYAILAYHPVTTINEEKLIKQTDKLIKAIVKSNLNYIIIYPNNDKGSEYIIQEYEKLSDNKRFKVFPSIRFEYYLSLIKNALFLIGNSSVGVREMPIYGKPSINIGSRQNGRYDKSKSIISVNFDNIDRAIKSALKLKPNKCCYNKFGNGNSDKKFLNLLSNSSIWDTPIQKVFYNIKNNSIKKITNKLKNMFFSLKEYSSDKNRVSKIKNINIDEKYKRSKVVAIIPARGGSKGIKNKNIYNVSGKSLISYSIEVALNTKLINDVIVSTDSQKIAEISKNLGAEVPFIRSKENSTDTSKTIDVVIETINKLKEMGREYDYIVLLQPTNPLRSPEQIDNMLVEMQKNSYSSIVTIVEFEKCKKHPIFVRTKDINNKLYYFDSSKNSTIRRQDLSQIYSITGNTYINRVDTITNETSFNDNEHGYIIDYDIDIDTLDDINKFNDYIKDL